MAGPLHDSGMFRLDFGIILVLKLWTPLMDSALLVRPALGWLLKMRRGTAVKGDWSCVSIMPGGLFVIARLVLTMLQWHALD